MKTTEAELVQAINDSLKEIKQSVLSPSAYDTAWLSLVKDTDDKNYSFPSCLLWIKSNQNGDGSWGDIRTKSYQDKINSTIMCAIALKAQHTSDDLVRKAESYINKNVGKITEDKVDGIAFELIFPMLIELAQRYGLNLPYNSDVIAKYKAIKDYKLSKLPIEYIYKKKTTLSYSLEFLETYPTVIDFKQARVNQESNGSYCTSPASTAFMLIHDEDPLARNYLKAIVDRYGYAPVVNPIDNFEASWTLNYFIDLNLTDLFPQLIKSLSEHLEGSWSDHGVAWSRELNLPDLDDTAVAYRALKVLGRQVDASAFMFFRKDGTFLGFEGQKDSNPSYVANLLRALEEADDLENKDQYIDECTQLLTSLLDLHTIDKWHLSEYYLISRLIFKSPRFTSQKVIDNVINSQNKDGGWGGNGSTPEETCYAISFLINNRILSNQSCKKALSYLLEHKDDTPVTLWISKCLYCPVRLTKVLINSTIIKLMHYDAN